MSGHNRPGDVRPQVPEYGIDFPAGRAHGEAEHDDDERRGPFRPLRRSAQRRHRTARPETRARPKTASRRRRAARARVIDDLANSDVFVIGSHFSDPTGGRIVRDEAGHRLAQQSAGEK
jgi:hypothetical protein